MQEEDKNEYDYKNFPEDEIKVYEKIKEREFYLGAAALLITLVGGIAIGVWIA